MCTPLDPLYKGLPAEGVWISPLAQQLTTVEMPWVPGADGATVAGEGAGVTAGAG